MINIVFNTYLPRLFDWVIETSIMTSVLVGIILCVKVLLRNQLTPRWHYLLWMILIVRLLLPWSPGSSFSIYSILLNGYESMTSEQSQSIGSSEKEQLHETTNLSGLKVVTDEERFDIHIPPTIVESKKEITNDMEKQEEEPLSIHGIALYVWLTGVIALGFTTYLANRRLQHYIKQQPVITDVRIVKIFESCKKSMSIQQNIPLLLAGKIPSPTLFGFFRPIVLLSNDQINHLTEQQLRHIFHHELAHIKRRDVGLNWLMHCLLILHWFNPIIWLAYVYMREDQELACDAYALSFLEDEEKISYGFTIITLLEHYANYYPVPSLAHLSRNKRTLKRRILMIKKFQKKSYRWSALGVMAVAAVAAVSLVNTKADGSTEKQPANNTEKEAVIENSEAQESTSPEKFVERYLELGKATDYEKLVDLVIDDRFNDDRQVKLDTYKMLEKDISPLENYEIKKVKDVTEDKATVITVLEFEDGSIEQIPMHLVKKDENWKLHISRGNASDDEDFKLIKQPDGMAQENIPPEEFVERYLELVKARDYEYIVDLVIDDRFNDDRQTKIEEYRTAQELGHVPLLEEYEIKEVKDVTEGEATVVTILDFNDGSIEQRPMHLVKKNGGWILYIRSGGDANADEDFKRIKQPDGI